MLQRDLWNMIPTQRLQILKAELESSRLEVMLVPLSPARRGYNEGGMKRVCASRNCSWYRKHCAANPSSRVRNRRKSDTRIKRGDTLAVLERLIAGKPSRSKYVTELLSFAGMVAG